MRRNAEFLRQNVYTRKKCLPHKGIQHKKESQYDRLLFAQTQWKPYNKTSTASHLRIYRNFSAKMFHNCQTNRQSQTGTLLETVHLVETFENMFQVFTSNSFSCIFHKQCHFFFFFKKSIA